MRITLALNSWCEFCVYDTLCIDMSSVLSWLTHDTEQWTVSKHVQNKTNSIETDHCEGVQQGWVEISRFRKLVFWTIFLFVATLGKNLTSTQNTWHHSSSHQHKANHHSHLKFIQETTMHTLQHDPIGFSFVPLAHGKSGSHAANTVPVKGHGHKENDQLWHHRHLRPL